MDVGIDVKVMARIREEPDRSKARRSRVGKSLVCLGASKMTEGVLRCVLEGCRMTEERVLCAFGAAR